MMGCVDEGRLRAYLDMPDSGLTADEQTAIAAHLAGCTTCAERARTLAATAALAGTRLAAWEPALSTAVESQHARTAYARFQRTLREQEWQVASSRAHDRAGVPHDWLQQAKEWVAHMIERSTAPGRRPALAAVAILAILAVALAFSPVSSLADQLFKTFRVQQFQAVTVPIKGMTSVPMPQQITQEQQQQLQQMFASLGTLQTNATKDSFHQVGSQADAQAFFSQHGGTLQAPTHLPTGYTPQSAQYGVGNPTSSQYTLNVAVAKQYLALLNSSELNALPWPQGVDKLTFGYDTPAMVATLYSNGTNGQSEQGFGILQMANTDPSVPGAGPILHLPAELDVNAFRTALLAVPNLLPQQTMDQIKNVSNWETTLIIPVPENAVTTNVTVKGNAGLLIVDGQGRGSLLVWQSGGKLYAVGGTISGDEAQAIANSLTNVH
ncbi:MAG: hypothetical protein ACTHMP_16775 [Thermomicrobiales bacterium]